MILIISRIGQNSCKKDGLSARQLVCWNIEIIMCCLVDSVNAITKLYNIEIDFHDSLFASSQFHEYGKIGFYHFPKNRTILPEKKIFCCLLGDCACSYVHGFMLHVVGNSTPNCIEIKAIVIEKLLIFCCHHRVDTVIGDCLDRHSSIFEYHRFSGYHLIKKSDNHQWCHAWILSFVEQDKIYWSYKKDKQQGPKSSF